MTAARTSPPSDVHWFNPFAEGFIAYGKGYSPRKSQALLALDLANLPQFLCRENSIVLMPQSPRRDFLETVDRAGFALPEFVELQRDTLPKSIRQRQIGFLRPWAWGPDSVALLSPLVAQAVPEQRPISKCFNDQVAALYSKAWSANLLRRVLQKTAGESCLCGAEEAGEAVDSPAAALDAIRAIRARGHHKVVAKEALGLAGHNSIRLWEPEVLPAQVRWMEQALEEGRRLVVEPWLERELDFSIHLEMTRDGLELCGYAGLVNDRKGQFQTNWANPDYREIPAEVTDLFSHPVDVRARLRRFYHSSFALLAEELGRAGYEGPLGIDAFVYCAPNGGFRVKPIVEINPRYTMGRLTLELMKHAAPDRYGFLRLLTLPMLQAKGFATFNEYARHLAATAPLRLQHKPDPRVESGALCLNDPERAQVCMAVLQVVDRRTAD